MVAGQQHTVAAVMAEMGLVARRRRGRRVRHPCWTGPVAATGPVGRHLCAAAINRKWYGDGTKNTTDEGRLYLDSVLDVGSRRVVGYALGEDDDADLAYGALAMAVAVRAGRRPR